MYDLTTTLVQAGVHRRFAVDVMSVVRGIRRVGLLHVPLDAETVVRSSLAPLDLVVFDRRELVRFDDPHSREGVLRECRPGEMVNYVELWFSRDSDRTPTTREHFINPGRHLGYPDCCVAEWERLQSQSEFYSRYLFGTHDGFWELNRLSTVFQGGLLFPDFYPCSLQCASARDYVAPFLSLAGEVLDSHWVDETLTWMKAALVIRGTILYAFPQWTMSDSELLLHVHQATRIPLHSVGTFDVPCDPRPRLLPLRHFADAARVTLVSEEGQKTALLDLNATRGT